MCDFHVLCKSVYAACLMCVVCCEDGAVRGGRESVPAASCGRCEGPELSGRVRQEEGGRTSLQVLHLRERQRRRLRADRHPREGGHQLRRYLLTYHSTLHGLPTPLVLLSSSFMSFGHHIFLYISYTHLTNTYTSFH